MSATWVVFACHGLIPNSFSASFINQKSSSAQWSQRSRTPFALALIASQFLQNVHFLVIHVTHSCCSVLRHHVVGNALALTAIAEVTHTVNNRVIISRV